MADNGEVHQTILYHLNMNHASAKIKEMDHLQFPSDFKKQWDQGHLNSILSMTDMWGPCREGGVKLAFFEDKKAWRLWLWVVHEVVMDWEAFDEWDWEGFTDVRNVGINKLTLNDFARLTVCILTFFINTFVTRLGYYPSPMLCPPILAGPHCAIHKKKFTTGLM